MKKVISFLLTVCIALSVMSVGFVFVSAEETEFSIKDSEVKWTYKPPVYQTDESGETEKDEDGNPIIEEEGVVTFSGFGALPDCAYDEEEGKAVTDDAPWNDSELYQFSKVVFGEGISAIGKYAFCGCSFLKNVTVPENAAVVGEGAFMNCTALESADILPETDISDNMFSGCTKLQTVVFENPGKVIGRSAFSNCSSLKEITVPDGVETISEDAFSYCSGLEKAVLPDSVKSVEQYAFYSCENLKTVDFGNGVEEIGNGAFSSCSSLESLVLPESVKSISSNAFYGCSALASVDLSDGVEKIGESAFNLCTELKDIEIGYNVTEIGSKAFGYGKRGAKIADFTVTGFNGTAAEKYASDNGFTFNSLGNYYDGSCGETALWSFDEETGILAVSGTGAMYDYTENSLPAYSRFADRISRIEIGSEITAIGDYAFYNMSVSGMLVPGTVAEIGEKAIGNFADGKVEDGFVIEGYRNSAAEDYAAENMIGFTDLKPIVTEGTCGEDVTWSYDGETKTFTLSGTGATYDYTLKKLPEYAKFGFDIENISVGEGITRIGDYALVFENAPMSATFTKDIEEFGEYAVGFIRTAESGAYEVSEIEDFEVNGYFRTPAKTYAEKNGFNFIPLSAAEPLDEIIEGAFIADVDESGVIYLYQTETDSDKLIDILSYSGYDAASVSTEIIGTGTTLEIGTEEDTQTFTFIVPGDIDGNGMINSSDALHILNHAVEASILTGYAFRSGDISSDGIVNSVDALGVLQISVGQKELSSFYISK